MGKMVILFFLENLHGWYGCKNWLSRGWNWWTIMCFFFCSFVFFFKCDLFNESSQDWEEMFLKMFVSDSMFWRFLDSTCFFRTEESTGFRTKNMHGHGNTCWLPDLFGFGFCFAYNRFNTAEVHFDKCGPFFALSLSRMRFINAVQSDWPIFRLLDVARISSAPGGFIELICWN